MAELLRTSCCGVRDIDDLSYNRTAKESMLAVCEMFYNEDMQGAFCLFTGTTRGKYAKRFRDYIINNGLGEVIETPAKINPNSGNRLKAYLWTIDQDGLAVWWEKNGVVRI